MNLRGNIIYNSLKRWHKRLEAFLKNTKKVLISTIVFVIFLFLVMKLPNIFFTITLILLGAFSMIYVRFFKYSHYIGLELCLMATVLTSLAYGPLYGAVTGFVSIFLAFVISGYIKWSIFISVLTLPVIGIVTPFFNSHVFHNNLAYLGVFMTILYDAIILPLYIMIGNSRIYTSAVFFITHVLLNAWIFSNIAPIFYRLMV